MMLMPREIVRGEVTAFNRHLVEMQYSATLALARRTQESVTSARLQIIGEKGRNKQDGWRVLFDVRCFSQQSQLGAVAQPRPARDGSGLYVKHLLVTGDHAFVF